MKKFLVQLVIFLGPLVAFAQNGPNSGNGPQPNNSGGGISNIEISFTNPLGGNGTIGQIDSVTDLISAILQIVISVGIPLIVLAIIYTGFLFVKAMGNPEEIKDARRAFTWVIIGAIVLLASFVIAEAIDGTIQQIINS